jgi:lysophospholipase L1-like esterase
MGVAGTTLADLLNGTNGVSMPWAQRVAQSTANVVSIKDGINDAYYPATTPAVFADQLTQAITVARAAGKIVVLETPNPLNNDHSAELAQLISAEVDVANKLSVPIIDNFAHFADPSNWNQYLSDGMHPTEAGYEIEGQNSFDTISPIVQALISGGPKIEAYGDSKEYGVTFTGGLWIQNAGNSPAYLQALLGSSAAVFNNGVPGSSGAMLLNGTDGVHPAWQQQMAQSSAKIITISHGTNDSGLGAETASDYLFVLNQLVGIARASGKTVVLDEPAPRCDDPAKAAKLDQFVVIMRQVAQSQGVKIVMNYDYIKSLPNWQAMMPDCVHPNADMYKLIATRESAIIAPLVSGQPG